MIYSKCPVCGSDDILRMRRITGYLTGSLESWNSAKQAEERDRVKAPVISILTGIFLHFPCGAKQLHTFVCSCFAPLYEARKPLCDNRIGGPLSARLKSKFTRRKNSFLPPFPVACGKSPPKV